MIASRRWRRPASARSRPSALRPRAARATRAPRRRGRRGRSRSGRRRRRRRSGEGSARARAPGGPGRAPRRSTRAYDREIGDPVRDLRPRRRDEVVEHPRGDVPLARRQRRHARARGAPRRSAARPRARSSVDTRSTRELAACSTSQSRCSTSCRYGVSIRVRVACSAAPRPPCRSIRPTLDVVEHRVDERGLDRDLLLAAELAVALERADDRRAAPLAVEPVEPELVREEAGDPRLEDVEPRERVLADAEQDVHGQARASRARPASLEQAAAAGRRRGRGSISSTWSSTR